MNNKKKLLIIIITTLFIITGIIVSLSYRLERNQPADSPVEEGEQKPDNQIKDIELVLYSSDRMVNWQVESGEIKNFSDKGLLRMNGIQVRGLRGDNEGTGSNNSDDVDNILYTIEGNDSLYRTGSGEIIINGPVHIDKNDFLLTAGQLLWQDGEDVIYGQQGVDIKSPHFVLEGEQFSADIALNKLTINGSEGEQALLRLVQ